MHSKIIQISGNEIKKSDWIEEDMFYEGFVGEIADYVADMCDDDRLACLDYMKSELEGFVDVDLEQSTLQIADRKAYFKRKYEEFENALSALSKSSFDDFASGNLGRYVYSLRASYDDDYSYYVYDSDYGSLYTFDSFMRDSEDIKYHIGALIDYHF